MKFLSFCRLTALGILFFNIAFYLHATDLPNGTGSPDAIRIDDSWRLWVDDKAAWQDDALYLPDEVDLTKLPVNPPTGGWGVLTDQAGIPVTLPGTVEEHFWGQIPPAKPATRPSDYVERRGSYHGVSWWYRSLTPPALANGDRLILSIPGARLRSEIYVNGHLVAYNIISEIPLQVDITDALAAGGANLLAIRITNPGGTLAWPDYGLTNWGNYKLPCTHDFSGIDGGVTLSVRSAVSVTDLYVANHPDPHAVTIQAQVSSSGAAYKGPVALAILKDGKEVWTGTVDVDVPSAGVGVASKDVSVPDAELWDIGHPALYRATASLPGVSNSEHLTDFGFRWFGAEGLGENARLALNGHRVVVKSAISWGFWAPNGMFPDKDAVAREISAAQSLGLNCIQNHRHFPKAVVLDGFDHAGLLRYCEPGGGGWSYEFDGAKPAFPKGPVDTSGTGGTPLSFTNRYETAKVLAMVKAYRSHPSIPVWTLLNEGGASVHNANIFKILQSMRQLDPSRLILLKSGFNPEGEIMGLPYSNSWTYGEKTSGNDSGWHDTHTCNDYEGVYLDSFYKGPDDHTYATDETKAISAWGEMATGASVDNVTAMAKWYSDHNVPGYDREAAEVLSKAYEDFLDSSGFRSAFPTAEKLFAQIGAKHYFSAAKVMENARIADANDYIVLSGWESTTIDNHCALVDALRMPKGDASVLKAASAPALLVVRPLHYVVAKGDAAVVDVHVVNEINLHGAYTLNFSAAMDATKESPFFSTSFPVTVTGGEIYAELLKKDISFTPPGAGLVTMSVSLVAQGTSNPVLNRTEPLLVVDPVPHPLAGPVACAGDDALVSTLQKQLGVTGVSFDQAPANAGTILVSSGGIIRFAIDMTKTEHIGDVDNTDDPGLYRQFCEAHMGTVAHYTGLAPGKARVEFFMVDGYFNLPGNRSFDLALNGKTVARDLDIVKEAGGKDRALVKQYDADCPNGDLTISIPRVGKDHVIMAGIRVTDAAGHVIREVFREEPYTSPNGDVWAPIKPGGFDWAGFLPKTMDRVKAGARLVLLTEGGDDSGAAAHTLDKMGLLKYSGSMGFDKTSWFGYWYFGRKHWLLDGLPSDCVLDWPYQAGAGGDGLRLQAPGMEGVIAVGMNHRADFGYVATVIPVGSGQIVFLAIPGLDDSFVRGDADGFQPVTARRLIYNALNHR